MLKAACRYSRWMYDASRGVRGIIVANVLIGWVTVALNLVFIWFSKALVDVASGKGASFMGFEGRSLFVALGSGLVISLVLRLVASAVNVRLEAISSARLNFKIRGRLFSALMRSQWQGKEKIHSGDTLNRLFTDVDTVTKVVCGDIPSVAITFFQLIAAFGFLCLMSWKLGLVLLLVTPLFVFLSRVFFFRMRNLTKGIRDSESSIQSHIQESIQLKTVLQSLEGLDAAEDNLEGLQDTEMSQVRRRASLNVYARLIMGLTTGLGYVTALLWGVHGIFNDTISFGTMTAFLQLVGQIQGPVIRMSRQIPSFIYATASIDRLSELGDSPMEEDGEQVLMQAPAGVRISGLSFRYSDGVDFIFKDFNYDFKPGSRTAITGHTGVGKSTLIRLMLSILRPTGGRIEVYDGNSAVEASPMTRGNFVYVPQGNTLFSGTVRDNLLLGCPEAGEEMLWAALHTAEADFVRQLPQGLDTVCGEKGTGLSEGQAQRIAIARGLLRPGSIMLFDEFSSSLDSATEERLLDNLSAEASGKTMIFITHREKVCSYCDGFLHFE